MLKTSKREKTKTSPAKVAINNEKLHWDTKAKNQKVQRHQKEQPRRLSERTVSLVSLEEDASERIVPPLQDEVEFWKEKALKLERKMEGIKGRIEALDKIAASRRSIKTSSTKSGKQPSMHTSSPEASLASKVSIEDELAAFCKNKFATSAASVAFSDDPTREGKDVGSIEDELAAFCQTKKKNKGSTSASSNDHPAAEEEDKQRSKDDVKHQLVLEMQRIIKQHTDTASNDDENLTSTLQELVSRVLAADMHNQSHVLYQLSCRGESIVTWTKRSQLQEMIDENYCDVWQVIQTAYGKGNAGIGQHFNGRNLSFRSSSFAHHVANQCHYCDSEDEVFEWCLYNIKVDLIL